MGTDRLRKVLAAVVGAALALGAASGALGFDTGYYEKCLAEHGPNSYAKAYCCEANGGSWVEVYNEEGMVIDSFCDTPEGPVDGLPSGDDAPHVDPGPAEQPAGNVGQPPTVERAPVDTIAPEVVLESGPPVTTRLRQVVFMFSTGEAATFECSLDGADPAPCTSPLVYSGLGKGVHEVSIVAIDAAGNADPSPAISTWKVRAKRRR